MSQYVETKDGAWVTVIPRLLYFLGVKMEFKTIKKACNQKMKINGNVECEHRRKLISGLDGCLCREDNCFKLKRNITS